MNENYDSLNEKELLTELLKAQKKTLLQTRIAAVTSVFLCIAVCISLIIIVPKTLHTLNNVNSTITRTNIMVESAEQSLEKINNINFEDLNKAIEDLSDVVEPLADLVNTFN